MTFLPENYEIPNASNGYMKLEKGENKFRVLSSAITGWEIWVDNKPKRFKESIPVEEAEKADLDPRTGVPRVPKHFWAFVVWNYNQDSIQILELTQKSIQKYIKSLTTDEDWGDPKGYDIVIKREGEGLETEYQVVQKPKKELAKEISTAYKETRINLDALYKGEDPFGNQPETDDIDEMLGIK